MAQIDTVLLKVASRCNINCTYCYVYNQGDTSWQRLPKHMSPMTIDAVVRQLRDLYKQQKAGFAVVLHGGEPLLMPPALLALLLEELANGLPPQCSISIQTNGTLISDELLTLCLKTNVTLSVSIDGPPQVHDRFRIAFNGRGTFEQTLKGICKIQQHPDAARIFTGVLSVVDPTSDADLAYRFYKSLVVPSIDFLFKDGNHSKLPTDKASFQSTEYGVWLTKIWDLYISDPNPTPIRILDDIAKLCLGGRSEKEGCGSRLYGIAVIDTDGSITKNDTLKSMFDGADRYTDSWNVSSQNLYDIAQTQEFAEVAELQRPTSEVCKACEFLHVCGGGMPLSRWHDANGLNNPSVYCADYKLLINHIQKSLFGKLADAATR